MSSSNSWYPVQPTLVQTVETYARLQLPPTNDSPPLNSIERYVKGESTGALVTYATRNLRPHLSLMPQGGISASNPGSQYQQSLADQVDTDSVSSGSDNSHYNPFLTSTDSSSVSPEEDEYTHQNPVSARSAYHDQAFGKPFGQDNHFMSQVGDLNAPVDPNLAPDGFVCPKDISPGGDDRSQEGHTDFMKDGEENEYEYLPAVPNMFQSCFGRLSYPYDQPTPPVGVYPQQHGYSLEHDHSCSSAEGTRQGSPARILKLKIHKDRRNKCSQDMMKPYTANRGEGEKARKPRGEKTRGRGAGKKKKEKRVCHEHPGKVFNHASDYKKHINQQHLRPFLCVYYFAGCTQTFGSKNEWKRHVNSQHLQLCYWHCDHQSCADRKAVFNRKDLFGQHIKRMHPPPAGSKVSAANYMETVIERCRVERREPPQNSRCGYCEKSFSGPQGWEQRMEHVGQHYEKNNYENISHNHWVPDEGLIAWSSEHGIIQYNGNEAYAILCTGKDAIVKAGVEQKKLARDEEMAGDEEVVRVLEYAGDDGDYDGGIDLDFERDAEGDDDEYPPHA